MRRTSYRNVQEYLQVRRTLGANIGSLPPTQIISLRSPSYKLTTSLVAKLECLKPLKLKSATGYSVDRVPSNFPPPPSPNPLRPIITLTLHILLAFQIILLKAAFLPTVCRSYSPFPHLCYISRRSRKSSLSQNNKDMEAGIRGEERVRK